MSLQLLPRETPIDDSKEKKKDTPRYFQHRPFPPKIPSIESMRGIARCNYTLAKGINACPIRRNARVQLHPTYSPDAQPNINSTRNK